MSRYDKYDPISGGFRAPLAAAYTYSETPVGVGLDVNGRVVVGAGNTGVIGVMVLVSPYPKNATGTPTQAAAGTVVDVMTHGEIVEFAGAAGTTYYADGGTGAIGTAAPAAGANATQIGHTVEASRLVVRVQKVQG